MTVKDQWTFLLNCSLRRQLPEGQHSKVIESVHGLLMGSQLCWEFLIDFVYGTEFCYVAKVGLKLIYFSLLSSGTHATAWPCCMLIRSWSCVFHNDGCCNRKCNN